MIPMPVLKSHTLSIADRFTITATTSGSGGVVGFEKEAEVEAKIPDTSSPGVMIPGKKKVQNFANVLFAGLRWHSPDRAGCRVYGQV